MKVIKFRYTLFSENPDKLADFYTRVLKFKQVVKVDRIGEYGYGIEACSGYKIWIAKHSKIKGKNKDPFRLILSFYVDNIADYFNAVKSEKSYTIIEEPNLTCVEIPNEERLVGAFLDIDGNCVQMMQLTGK